jgi:alcohol dehydrogenase (NADP+)
MPGLVLTYSGFEPGSSTPTYGGYSDSIVVKEGYVLSIPANLPLDAAAPLLCAGITLYSPLRHWNAGPGKKVAIVGMGGLGHMGVKLAHAMGAEVTVLSQSLSKRDDGLRLGATHYHSTNDAATFATLAGTFDLIICTVSSPIDWNAYLGLLRVDGTFVVVGAPEQPVPVHAFAVIPHRRSLAGSMIGSIKETQEMLDFCGANGIVADIETIAMDRVNEAYERIAKSDVRYRFVIDMATLD